MTRSRDAVGDYLRSLSEEPEELRFLRSIPWAIDAGTQDPSELIRSLRLEAPCLAELTRPVLFSLITPMWNTPPRLLEELILSVRCQSYVRWELILVDDGSPRRDHIEVARRWADRDGRIRLYELDENLGISGARNRAIEHSCGDFLAILDHDDLLHPSALGVFARRLDLDPEANVIFCNEAKITEESDRVRLFTTKPPFDLFTLLRTNYVCHFTAIRRDLVLAAARDGRVFRSEYDGAEDHDLFLRVAMTGRARAIHVPLFLYLWRMTANSTSLTLAAKPEIPERRLRMYEDLMPELYPGARWDVIHPHPGAPHHYTSVRIRSLPDHPRPSVLALVPFRDDPAETIRALESLENQQHGLDVAVTLVDRGSTGIGTRQALDDWIGRQRRLRYEILEGWGTSNPAGRLNEAVERRGAGKDLVLFLDRRVELRSFDCLQTMAMQAMADRGCGLVGIKLLDPAGQGVRAGGLRLLEDSRGSGYYRIAASRNTDEFVGDERVAFAVPLSCAMIRREVYEELGGLDAAMFPDGSADVDLCARALERGYRNYYFGTLTGLLHGTEAPGWEGDEPGFAALHERHARTFAFWRLRNLSHTDRYAWPRPVPAAVPPALPAPDPVIPPPPHAATASDPAVQVVVVPAHPPDLPLRYRVADRVNRGLKILMPGPAHRLSKRLLLGGWRALKPRGRGDAAGPRPDHPEPGGSHRRPAFLRRGRIRSR